MSETTKTPAEREKNRGLPLAALIILPFLVLFMFFFSAIFLINVANFRSRADSEHKRRTEELSRRIQAYLELFFADPVRLVQMNEDMILSGRLDHRNMDELAFYFSMQLRRYPYLTFISMGFPDGQYIGASRPPDGSALSIYRVLASEGSFMSRYLLTEDGVLGALVDRGASYDATQRPWYRAAMEGDGILWYPAYRYATSDDYGMGASKQVVGRDGTFLGVVTADAALTEVNRYLQGLLSAEWGLAWVANEEGRLIASSADLPIYLGEEVAPEPGPNQSKNEKLYHAAMEARTRAGGAGRHVPFRHNGEGFQADLVEITPAQGLRLYVGIAMPESAFVGDMVRGGIISSVLGGVALIVAALLGVLIAFEVSSPVKRIQERASRLAAGDWSGTPVRVGPARELAGLAEAFESMASSLRGTLDTLEERVNRRTAELQNLLREVHHRMKNNFTLAAAMLSLQASQAASEETSDALEEARERLLSMALLYDRLYHSADLKNAVSEAYLPSVLEELRTALIGSRPLRLIGELGQCTLNPGKAAGVGIIITELVTNACKYAFPAAEGGTITVRADAEDDKLALEVEDNGCGFPADFSLEDTGSFGLTLVQALANQYDGELTLVSHPGRTSVRMVLDVLA